MDIGDNIWRVKRNLNMHSQKIKMVDDKGIEWYRYETPRSTYEITEGYITAIRNVTIKGNEIFSDWADEAGTRYTVRFRDGLLEEVYEEDVDTANDGAYYTYFSSKGEAETYLEEQFEKLK